MTILLSSSHECLQAAAAMGAYAAISSHGCLCRQQQPWVLMQAAAAAAAAMSAFTGSSSHECLCRQQQPRVLCRQQQPWVLMQAAAAAMR